MSDVNKSMKELKSKHRRNRAKVKAIKRKFKLFEESLRKECFSKGDASTTDKTATFVVKTLKQADRMLKGFESELRKVSHSQKQQAEDLENIQLHLLGDLKVLQQQVIHQEIPKDFVNFHTPYDEIGHQTFGVYLPAWCTASSETP